MGNLTENHLVITLANHLKCKNCHTSHHSVGSLLKHSLLTQ